MGVSIRGGPGRPSSRDTSTAIVSRVTFRFLGCSYKEPHGCTKAGRKEPVERADWVDVDRVRAHRLVFWGAHRGVSSPSDSQT
jgi:hypothetical protein